MLQFCLGILELHNIFSIISVVLQMSSSNSISYEGKKNKINMQRLEESLLCFNVQS